jgi:ribosome-binding factor A
MPAKSFNRSDRVSAELRREIALLVHAAVREHALPSVSVSDVEVTKDLDVATVYVTALLGEEGPRAVAALNELAREFRRELSRSMKLRRVPELRFRYDDSVDRGERIETLLRGDRGDGEPGPGDAG